MKLRPLGSIAKIALFGLLAGGCGSNVTLGEGFGDGSGNVNGGDGGGGSGGGGAATTTSTTGSATATTSSGPQPCGLDPNVDSDGDGATPAGGDCDDCEPLVGPGSVEVPTAPGETPLDEDCSGAVDDIGTCDGGLAVDDYDPLNAARAIELCKSSSGPGDWGVVEAHWVLADGSAPPVDPAMAASYHLGHGILPAFGAQITPRAGQKLLALSSGVARQPTDADYMDVSGYAKGYTSLAPVGFPKESPACPGVVTGAPNDDAALEISLRVPANATGFAFDFDFFTYEWPNFICSSFNDFFVALLSPFPAGQLDGNISFDSQGNPVSVNNAFLDVCSCPGGPPCLAGGKTYGCALGAGSLVGTGFGQDAGIGTMDHGSTEWLVTSAPVAAFDLVSIRLAVYDSGDGVLDTSTLIDNWRWIVSGSPVVQTIRADPEP